jgi:hypothetical protein
MNGFYFTVTKIYYTLTFCRVSMITTIMSNQKGNNKMRSRNEQANKTGIDF